MLHRLLEARLQPAVAQVLPDAVMVQVPVRPCPDAQFGDYQCQGLMALARERKLNPRDLADKVRSRLEVADLCSSVETAGAGFLNFRVRPSAYAQVLRAAARGEHLFFEPAASPRTVVIDFSSPNVAKPMHVGHIRSTLLGDCLARVFRLLGHRVVTDNHLGDWGTQFGMLLVGWKTLLNRTALETDPVAELERVYRDMNARCGGDSATLEAARAELVKLQSGDAENLAIWREMIRLSQIQFDALYGRLGVRFDRTLGESFYNSRLRAIVEELATRGLARESAGAQCIFSDGTLPPKEDPFLTQREGKWADNPMLVRKSDGGFNYATTDLATLQYRMETWNPDAVVYVTDGRQQLHFRQLFASFRRWQPERAARVQLAHVWFGSILGEDGRPFKTRSGETVKLADLLDEAEERALAAVTAKNPELAEPERRAIARVVGLGAVKYQDLLPNRQSDYVFSWEKMLALQGNTAPYLQYACVRVRSIFRRGEVDPASLAGVEITPAAPEELALARHLAQFGFVLDGTAAEYRPNFLCNYLFELAGHFARFFENCPVLKAAESERASRLGLCLLTAEVLRTGLGVLGIEVPEQM